MDEINTGYFKVIDNKNIYVIGDIHGDYEVFTHILVDLAQVCNVENNKLVWKENNDSIIVFCGDVIHRKRFIDHVLDDENSDILILDTIFQLQKDSKRNNGRVILIAGNHEIMSIINPEDLSYTSEKNVNDNVKFFDNKDRVNEFINNSYAWVKINDTLIAHGGLCSDYLGTIQHYSDIIKNYSKDDNNIISTVNNIYRKFFIKETEDDDIKKIGYSLFVEYDLDNKFKHNMFWCREWGYDEIDCENFKNNLEQIDCKKMIIAHCPQFMSPKKPKTITFQCVNGENNNYNLARLDLGMSRCFDYNKEDQFLFYLQHNHYRKMSILKIFSKNNNMILSPKNIITKKLSAIQYVLIKNGYTIDKWKEKGLESNWLGFSYIKEYINTMKNNKKTHEGGMNNTKDVFEKLLEPVFNKQLKKELMSINY